MTVYIGRPGSLVALRSPKKNLAARITRASRVKETIGGGRVVDYAPDVLREWTFQYSALSHEDQSTLMEYFAGHNGPGPFVLIDGAERNLLTRNQSSATSAYNDTTGFSVLVGTETLASVTTPVDRGPRALSWSLPAVVTGGVLSLAASRSDWPGIPVVPGASYRLQFRVRGGGSDAVVDTAAALRWLDSAGANLSLDTGSTVTTASGSWGSPSVTATCPVGGVYLIPRLIASAASVSATSIVYVDRPMLSMPTTRDPGTTWVAGLGVARVSVQALEHTLSWINAHQTGLTLSEVS